MDDSRVKATKRRRTDEDGSGVVTAAAVEKAKGHENPKGQRPKERFQRVKADQVTYHDERLKDNTFTGRVVFLTASKRALCLLTTILQNATTNDYGARAHRDLIVTRGAGFRKEKNKKKRGSYRGGEITVSRSRYTLICLNLFADGES